MDSEDLMNSTSIFFAENNAFATILGLFGMVGIFGNTTIIIYFVKTQKRIFMSKKEAFVFMIAFFFHHAIANTMLLLTIPFSILEKLNGYWNLSQSACKFYQGIIYFSYSASLLLFLARFLLSLVAGNYGKWKDQERFLTKQTFVLRHICTSTVPIVLQTTLLSSLDEKKQRRFGRHYFKFLQRSAIALTILIYVISVLIALPAFIFSDKSGYEFCSCNILFPDTNKRLSVCEEFAARFPAFNFNSPTKNCISQQEFSDFRYAADEFLRNTTVSTNKTKLSNVNITGSIMTTSKNALVFHSTTNVIGSNEYENFSVSFSQETCLDNLKQASISLKVYMWVNFLCLFLVCFVFVVFVKFTLTKIRKHAVQLLGNKPKLLRNTRKFHASLKQNIDECLDDIYNKKINTFPAVSFALCWFVYYLIEIIKLHFYSSLSENTCRTLNSVSMAIIYINAGYNIFIVVYFYRNQIKKTFFD